MSVGGTCKAPLLPTAADSELLNCSNCCVDGLLMQRPALLARLYPASPWDVKWERWSVTLWGWGGRECSGAALLQPSAGTQLCKCRTRQLCSSNLPSLHCSFHTKSISGWSSSLSMGHQKVGFEHEMGFI